MSEFVGAAFVILSALSAARFLSLALETRKLPELCIFLTCIGLAGSVLSGFAPRGWDIGIAMLCTGVSGIANAWFVATMLGSRERARIALAVSAFIVAAVLTHAVLGAPAGSWPSSLRLGATGISFAWGAFGFAALALRFKKRLALDLATHLEFTAFALVATAQLAIAAVMLVRTAGDASGWPEASVTATQLWFALAGAVAGWGGLAPPRWMRTRLEATPEAGAL